MTEETRISSQAARSIGSLKSFFIIPVQGFDCSASDFLLTFLRFRQMQGGIVCFVMRLGSSPRDYYRKHNNKNKQL